jgi:hypothetical protein
VLILPLIKLSKSNDCGKLQLQFNVHSAVQKKFPTVGVEETLIKVHVTLGKRHKNPAYLMFFVDELIGTDINALPSTLNAFIHGKLNALYPGYFKSTIKKTNCRN